MKKFIIAAMIAIIAAVSYKAMALTGDVNGDDVVNAADVTALYNWILNNDDSALVNGDVNGDGVINAGDITTVYNIILSGGGEEDTDPYHVDVVYDGNEATVTVASNIRSQMTVKVDGAHVNIVASPALQDSVIYNLSGSTTDGCFYMDGDYKCFVNLNDVTITNPDSAAINIDNSKRIDLTLNGNNTLTDATGGAQKACCFINGHVVLAGDGSLTITGNSKHGYFSDEYTKVTSGTITVNSVGDAFHINQYLQIDGGTVTLNSTGGDGVDVGCTNDITDTNNGQFIMNNGSLTVTTSANAVKGIKSESIMTIAGGTITSTTSGNAVYDAATIDISSCAAIKCDSTFNMTSGTVYLTSTGTGGKGLNCDGSVNISGGTFTAITTGDVYEYSSTLDTKPQGVKADGNITLSGGTVRVAASSDNGKAFSSKMSFWTNGGYILGIGGKSSTVSSGYTQKYKYYRSQIIKGGTTVTYDGVSFDIPSIYNNSAALIVVSTPNL